MRKAGQVGLWLVLVVASWMPVSAMAQDGPPESPPSRIESDPALSAASEAWHAAWRKDVQAYLRTVAARGMPRDLLIAGWLWPVESDDTSRPEDVAAANEQARLWIQAAYDTARGDDALVDWALLEVCRMTGATCDRAQLLQRLVSADPGNAEVLLAAYQDAVERRDTAAAERYWQAAAAGTHYHPRINALGTLMVSALRQAPAPALDPALAAAIGEDIQLGRDATPRDMADIVVMARNSAVAVPTLVPIRQRCTAQVGAIPPATRLACKRIYTLLANDETTLITSMLSLPRLVEWAETDAERDAARERLRRFAWVYESLHRLDDPSAPEQKVPGDYIDVLFRDGEFAALRLRLEINGIPTEPPSGWLPEHPGWRALLTGAQSRDP
ncbi:hypothetical protein [Pseudoxanthomonas sp. PXM02]|uniref:hypothetical protein n=1 Tax=Pseudoxanthomonas sp. PXM02 TaxID=2769294 RepID=UPI0017830F12|nr:hypothetical protein [Pseudoxanthomonas sp. PXM02]MBD9480509.1 hypothetical protein [Pseudoxanthomonas sp. PXM02]